jgi:hypothetical protein
MALEILSLSIARFVPVHTWQTKTTVTQYALRDQLKDLAKDEIKPSEVELTRLVELISQVLINVVRPGCNRSVLK